MAMSALFKKMNLTTQSEIAVFNAPKSFDRELNALRDIKILRDPKKPGKLGFAVAFAVTQAELERYSALMAAASQGDAILWFAYPKGTSKRYRCEFNRDQGWQVIRAAGFESVRQVAIDEDWSALRFRRVAYVKNSIRAARPAGKPP
jgi:hypothetical protein